MSSLPPMNPLQGSAADLRAPLPEPLCRPAEQLPAGPVLLFAPHPDDDLLGAGCTAAIHAERGDSVVVVVAYDGALGRAPDDPRDVADFVAQREAEAVAGGRHLGLTDYRFLRYPEGHVPGPQEFLAGAQGLAQMIDELRPGVVYAPWIGEHQLDHHVLARVVRAGLELAEHEPQAWGYEIWTPQIPTRMVDVSSRIADMAAGLEEHKSQLEHTDLIHHVVGMKAHRALYLKTCVEGCKDQQERQRREPTHGESLSPLGPCHPDDLALLGRGGAA